MSEKEGPSELEKPEEASSLHGKEVEKLKIEVEQKHGNPRWKRRAYSKRRWIAGGASEGPSSEHLKPAIATEKPRVFLLKEEERRCCS